MNNQENPAENPPAFPTHSVGKEPGQAPFQVSEGGMTLRDYFAAKARELDIETWQAIFAHNNIPITREEAKFAYADAMLKARVAK